MDKATVETYERGATDYRDKRGTERADRAEAFADSLPPGGLRLDLGTGPGHYLPHLGRPIIAADAAFNMIVEAGKRYADAGRTIGLVCDVESLPVRRGAFAGVWASKCLQHVTAAKLPMALTGLHRALVVGGLLDITLFAGEGTRVTGEGDDFPGRLFTFWHPDTLQRLLVGAGFEIVEVEPGNKSHRHPRYSVIARRIRSLPDTVGPGMRLLVVGLNPSLYAADAGVGFARPGNRFWPAALAAGLVSADRDPDAALRDHGVGMTDVVKRATAAASELSTDEYRRGLDRIEQLVMWLQPSAICFVGLAGWRAAVDRSATQGVQPNGLAGVPVYVMPSTSGLNARTRLAELTDHLRKAAVLAGTA